MENAPDPKYRWFSVKLRTKGNTTESFVYRALTRKEQKKLAKMVDEDKCEMFLLNTCVLNKCDFLDLPAGTYKKLLQLITNESGMDDDSKPFFEAKEWIESELGCLEAAAVATLPCCSLEMLDNSDMSYYWKYLLVAQVIFTAVFRIDPSKAFNEKAPNPQQQNPHAPLPSQQYSGRPTTMVENQGTIIAKK